MRCVPVPWQISPRRGDPAENTEYANATTELAFVERRIAELEGKPAAAQVIDPRKTDAIQ